MQKVISLLLLHSAANLMSAEPIQFQSSANHMLLLELYTSDGCSSCPPAEAWLARLKSDPRLWKDFVPVAFHVDYWDYLGWRDPFGAADYSDPAHVRCRMCFVEAERAACKEFRFRATDSLGVATRSLETMFSHLW
jgi:hypothetical protein